MKKATTEYYLQDSLDDVKFIVQEDFMPNRKEGKYLQIKFNQDKWRSKGDTLKMLSVIVDELKKFNP
jgi:hypothetical protein